VGSSKFLEIYLGLGAAVLMMSALERHTPAALLGRRMAHLALAYQRRKYDSPRFVRHNRWVSEMRVSASASRPATFRCGSGNALRAPQASL
jgi:hypothetical protein